MRAMILAAGRGERMGELTRDTPKPLLRVGENFLIEFAINQLKSAGVSDIVINVSFQANKIKDALGNGNRYGVNIVYSEELERLETGGGIVKALPLLGDAPFIVMSCDIITDFSIATLPKQFDHLAHLVMVNNPDYHPGGDFHLTTDGQLNLDKTPRLTFANIGVYHPKLFAHCEVEYFRLTKLLHPAILAGNITGVHYQGRWHNVGTAADLQDVTEHAVFAS